MLPQGCLSDLRAVWTVGDRKFVDLDDATRDLVVRNAFTAVREEVRLADSLVGSDEGHRDVTFTFEADSYDLSGRNSGVPVRRRCATQKRKRRPAHTPGRRCGTIRLE